MTDFSSLQTKVNDLKAKVAQNSISPSYLGELLEDLLNLFNNYVDIDSVRQINKRIDSILGQNASEAIDNFNEVLKFLEGITDDEKLIGLLDVIRTSLNEVETWKNSVSNSRFVQQIQSVKHSKESVSVIYNTNTVDDNGSTTKTFEINSVTDNTAGVMTPELLKDLKKADSMVEARHEQAGVSAFGGMVDGAEFNVMDDAMRLPQLDENHVYEVVWDTSRSRWMFIDYEKDSRPLMQSANRLKANAQTDWSAWSNAFAAIVPYGDFFDDKGSMRTDRVYQCQGRMYCYNGSALTEIGAKEALAIDMWLNRGNYGAKQYTFYDASKGDTPYGIEDLWVSYQEVLTILSIPCLGLGDATTNAQWFYQFVGRKLRAMFPIVGGLAANLQSFFGIYSNPGLEMVRILDYYNITNADSIKHNDTPAKATALSSTYRAFCTCKQLRKWLGYYKISYTGHCFQDANWPELEELYVQISKTDSGTIYAFRKSNKVKYDCLRFLVDNANITGVLTVPVHEDIWDALCGGGAPPNNNGGTDDEWTQLMIDAVAKNISFATA